MNKKAPGDDLGLRESFVIDELTPSGDYSQWRVSS
jgi:hypothetical protein